ncbi:MAG: hypothetical protein ABJK25_11130 [Halieaceae bacterium]
MPKTAGLSFRAALEEHYGAAFQPDYSDFPLAQRPEEAQAAASRFAEETVSERYDAIACIHGHFLPVKYMGLAKITNCTFVTWLRDPIARLISHYAYWHRSYDPTSEETSSLHRKVVEEAWSLEQFCLSPQLRNVYSRFLWQFPLDRFDFVGITEFFEEDLRYFSTRFLGHNATQEKLNMRPGPLPSALEAALGQLDLPRIAAYHEDDVALYSAACSARERRCGPG